MVRFRHKPCNVFAVRWNGNNREDIARIIPPGKVEWNHSTPGIEFRTDNMVWADIGDWLVNDPNFGCRVMEDELFQRLYEPNP